MNKRKEAMAGWLFMTPALFIFLTLILMPVVFSFMLSFTDWNFLSGMSGIKGVGLKNFQKLFTRDRRFKNALINTVLYAVTTAPISTFLALLLANVLNGKVFLSKFYRMCFFIPYISSMVALSAVFRFLFSTNGPVNLILDRVFGVAEPPNWLMTSGFYRVPIISVMIYSGIGFSLIVYMAALQAVPKNLYEAASIDGAGPFTSFFRITLPMISPTTFYLLIVRMIAAFKIFTAVNVMGQGNSSNTTLVARVYAEAFGSYEFGYGSAIAWVLVGIILIVTVIQMWGQKKWVHY